MTTQALSLTTALHQLAAEAGTVGEFVTRAQDLLAARLGPDLARRVVDGHVATSPAGERHELAVDAVAMVRVCRDLLESRQGQRHSDRQAASTSDLCRLLLESAGAGIYGVDPDGRCTFINAEGLRLLGFDHDSQVLGRNMHALVHHTRGDGSPYPVAECSIFEAHREGRALARDDEMLFRRDGSSFPAQYRSDPVVRNGQIEGSVLTFTDITERRRTEAELEQSRSLQQMAGEIAHLGGWSIDVARQEVIWSKELYKILNYPRDAQPQLDEALSRYLPPDPGRVEQALQQCAATGAPFDLEAQIETYDAQQLWVRVIGGPRYGPDGTITHIDGAFQDIDQLKASTQRAEELRERLASTLESITDAFWTVDDDWRMTYINQRAEQLLVRSSDELLGANLWESFPEASGSVLDEVYHRVKRTGVSEVIEEFYWHPLDLWLDIHVYAADQGLAVYFRDVSDQRKVRLELRERETRVAEQAALLDKARDVIIVRDLDHRVTYWNHSAERFYGYSATDALGHPLRELVIHDDEQFDQANATLLENDEWVGEFQHVAQDGNELIMEARWTLVRDDDGQPTSVLSIESDVTERRRVEHQLLRAQRLESIGTLAGGVAHDLNNVLAPIVLASGLIRTQADDSQIQELADIIASSATRGTDLVTQVLYFAQGVDGQRLTVDVTVLLRDIANMVRDTFPKNIVLAMDVPSPIPTVVGDSTQLQQILLNLAINARDAMPEGGTLSIRAFDVALDAQYLAADAEAGAGDYLVIEVEDTGTGMSAEVQDRIFEPFFTTKPHGAGTGLGLSTSLGIVESHGGFIRVYSDLGHGTRFRVHLPLNPQTDLGEAIPQRPGPPPQGTGQTVLVVDDEPLIRTTTCQTLQANGYQCLTADNGAEAVSVFAQHRDQIAAVIIDMMMPIMDGPATIHALQNMAADLTIVGASGLHGDGKTALAVKAGVRHFLPKPYTARTLLETLSVALDEDVPRVL